MKYYCRTCLLEITDLSCLVVQNWESVKFELLFCVPELEIDLVRCPTLCISCLNSLHLCYQFKNLCLVNEQRVYHNMAHLQIGSNSNTLEEVLGKTAESSPAGTGDNTVHIDETIEIDDTTHTSDTNMQYFHMGSNSSILAEMLSTPKPPFSRTIPENMVDNTAKLEIDNTHHITDNFCEPQTDTSNNAANWENTGQVVHSGEINNTSHITDNFYEPQTDTSNNADNWEEVIERQTGMITDYRAEMISNFDNLSSGNIQFVELSEEHLINEFKFSENKYIDILNMATEDDLEKVPVFNEIDNSSKQQIKLNLLGKRRTKYICDLCDFSTTDKEQFALHTSQSHIDERSLVTEELKYTCNLCNICFANKPMLTGHMVAEHNIDQLVRCSLCDYICLEEKSLVFHMKEHVTVQENRDVITID